MKAAANHSVFPSRRIPLAGLLAVVLCAGAFSAPALAARGGARNPCAPDVARLCPDVPRGGGRIARCLHQHEDQLSPLCKARMDAIRDEARELAQACRDDVKKQCKDVQRGGGRILQCLRLHESDISPQCRAKLDDARARENLR